MLARNQTNALQSLKRELNDLGYVGSLIRENYEFADVLSNKTAVNRIPLAAFAQDPPSYRNAAFGVAIANGHSGPELIQTHRALGAPQIFEVNNDRILRWKVSGDGKPSLLDEARPDQLSQLFAQHREEWVPQRILRAKSNASQAYQLDFFDLGLLPLLEQEARSKLNWQLSHAVNLAIETYKHKAQFTDDLYPPLFRLIFRLIAAKMLADRQHTGDWYADDAQSVLHAVEAFYFTDGKVEPPLEDPTTQQKTWEWIQRICHFQNLSVDSLAYVYENTLVTQGTRKAYGTHSTPYSVAEYIVRNLPFEDLGEDERKVFEPFSGHAIFLIAAMQRMRELLPSRMSPAERHQYFVKMLSGIEEDDFAVEVARLSLMLADYPNPDGWRLHKDDAFASPQFVEELSGANIVLCNPPFEVFDQRDEATSRGRRSRTKAAEALKRVLTDPPQLLGFVLPRVFVKGTEYKQLRREIGHAYKTFEILALPDKVFAHSDAETVLLLASKTKDTPKSLTVGQVLSSDLHNFHTTHDPTFQTRETVDEPAEAFAQRMWLPQLSEVWSSLTDFPTLENVADTHRGIEYNQRLKQEHSEPFVSDTPLPGFVPGLHKVRGAIEPFIVTRTVYLNVSEEFMRGHAYKREWNDPKLIVNANRKSRGNWRITASIDRSSLVCYQNFHAIWPKTGMPLEILAAVLNGPVANAFISTTDLGRNNLITTLRDIPIPQFSQSQVESLVSLVHQYVDTRDKWINQQTDTYEAQTECRRLIVQIDDEVLQAYDLPSDQERKLLDWFIGSTRLGPVEFTEDFPRSFKPRVPSHQYISGISTTNSSVDTLSEKILLFHELQADFVAEPVEAGMAHEAERTLSRALSNDSNKDPLDWLMEFCTDVDRPSFASSILRCLANLDNPGTTNWRVNLVRDALHTGNVDIKEAAVQAVEHWGESQLVNVLSSHQEDVPWLREYIEGVIDDLWE